ncbi:MAG: hypothetical protein HKM99_05475 [Flavobacteriaceae bacterium]|nr:hypothetical protein [Flavobacteriaceae bacterium]
MADSGLMIVMAYPETVVMVADEWYSPYLRYFGIGKKNYVRAGHAALVLIDKKTGELEYHDFGRYITPEPNGRVRGKDTDHELDFPLKAQLDGCRIVNLNEILEFLSTNPHLTHGEGKLLASVCDRVDYDRARSHITEMQTRHFIRYAAFIDDACNCARFVTGALIAGVTDQRIVRRLKRSTWFTPSTIGNVILADTQDHVYEVSEFGTIDEFSSSVLAENRKYFLDRLSGHTPNFVGTLKPRSVNGTMVHAQWLSGIAAGAWYELHNTEDVMIFRFRRISPVGHIDLHGLYKVQDDTFIYGKDYSFVHYSNCKFFHIHQDGKVYRFDYIKPIS